MTLNWLNRVSFWPITSVVRRGGGGGGGEAVEPRNRNKGKPPMEKQSFRLLENLHLKMYCLRRFSEDQSLRFEWKYNETSLKLQHHMTRGWRRVRFGLSLA